MAEKDLLPKEQDPDALICCRDCRHFQYYENPAGHNSPHALGKCRAKPWDGTPGQWALFQHHCSSFERASN